MAASITASERFFDRLLSGYRRSLRLGAGQSDPARWSRSLLTIALNVVLVIYMPKGFFPQQDTGAIIGGVQGPAGLLLPGDGRCRFRQIGAVIKNDPARRQCHRIYGRRRRDQYAASFTSPSNRWPSARSALPSHQPAAPQAEPLAGRLGIPASLAGLCVSAAGPSNALYQYTLQSDSVDDLFKWGPILLAQMKGLPGLQDVNSDQQNGGLETLMNYDRVAAAKLGLTAQSLDSALYSAFGQSEVSIIYSQLNQYYVVLEVAPAVLAKPGRAQGHLLADRGAATCRCSQWRAARPTPRRWRSTTPVCSPRSPCRSIWRRTCR